MKKYIITITAITASFGLAACGDVSSDQLRDALVEQGASEQEADCVVEYMEENLDDDQFQEAAKADSVDEVDAETLDVVIEAITDCQAF